MHARKRVAARMAVLFAGAATAIVLFASHAPALLADTNELPCTRTTPAGCQPTTTTPAPTEPAPPTPTEPAPTVPEPAPDPVPPVTTPPPAPETTTTTTPAPTVPAPAPVAAPKRRPRPAVHWSTGTKAARPVLTAKARAEAKAKPAAGAALDHSPHVAVPFGLSLKLPAPPSYLVRTYRAAGRRYDVPWKILAAINGIETGYGRNLEVSSAGAIGWMQFMPATWRIYGNGGNPYAPRDAIFAAARLLHANGASADLPAAIFAYNHADWYVAAVMWQAANMDSRGRQTTSAHGYELPLDARYMAPLGRTDDGVDIENAPDGAPVYSMTPGIVVAVAADPGGFGPNYPVVLVTDGPLAGRYVYYGHVAASLVERGQTVQAGQPIAVMGHTGDAAGLGHGHIEIGFSDGSGTPLEQHGAEAWTASGQAMRGVLASLTHDRT